jgi:uncharacterized protein YjbI with pentapeptide repeats
MLAASGADFSAACADTSQWTQSVLHSSRWPRASLRATRLIECDLSHADLSDADLSRADLSNANVHALKQLNTRWDGANLKTARKTDEALARAEQWRVA